MHKFLSFSKTNPSSMMLSVFFQFFASGCHSHSQAKLCIWSKKLGVWMKQSVLIEGWQRHWWSCWGRRRKSGKWLSCCRPSISPCPHNTVTVAQQYMHYGMGHTKKCIFNKTELQRQTLRDSYIHEVLLETQWSKRSHVLPPTSSPPFFASSCSSRLPLAWSATSSHWQAVTVTGDAQQTNALHSQPTHWWWCVWFDDLTLRTSWVLLAPWGNMVLW